MTTQGEKVILVGGDEVETADIEGSDWVGLIVWPRGFANEFKVYGCRTTDAYGLETLRLKIETRKSADPGDNYDCRWMTREEFSQHVFGTTDHQGWRYICTPDGDVVRL